WLVHRSDHSIDGRLALGGEGFGRVRRHQGYRPPAFGDDHLLAGFYGRENLGKALIGLARGDASHCMLQGVRVVHLARAALLSTLSHGAFSNGGGRQDPWRSEAPRHILAHGSSRSPMTRGNMPYIQIADDVRSLAGACA